VNLLGQYDIVTFLKEVSVKFIITVLFLLSTQFVAASHEVEAILSCPGFSLDMAEKGYICQGVNEALSQKMKKKKLTEAEQVDFLSPCIDKSANICVDSTQVLFKSAVEKAALFISSAKKNINLCKGIKNEKKCFDDVAKMYLEKVKL
jgi:hypothetical protein